MIVVVDVRSYSADAGQYVGRHRNLEIRRAGSERGGDSVLVGRIGVRVEQTDRHRFDGQGDHPLDRPFDRLLGKRGHHLTAMVDPLLDLDDAVAWHQDGALVVERVEELGNTQAPDLQDIAETGRGDERAAGAGALPGWRW